MYLGVWGLTPWVGSVAGGTRITITGTGKNYFHVNTNEYTKWSTLCTVSSYYY